MSRKKIYILVAIFAILSLYTFTALAKDGIVSENKTEELKEIEKIIAEFEEANKEIPESLINKLEFEKKLNEEHNKKRPQRIKEMQERAERIASLPRTKDGKIIKPENSKLKEAREKEEAVIEVKSPHIDLFESTSRVLPPHIKVRVPHEFDENYYYSSMATLPYLNKVIAVGYDRATEQETIILFLDKNEDDKIVYEDYLYPDAGKIVLDSFESNYQIITFTYSDNKSGYINVDDNSVYFEVYKEN